MRRYSIRHYAKCTYIGRKLCLCDRCDILLDVATPNITSLSSIVFDEHWYYHRTNIYTIRILSRNKSTRFRNTSNNRIKTGLRGLYNCGKI